MYGENDQLITPQSKNTRLRVNIFCATNPAVASRERAPTPTTRASVTSPRSALSPSPGEARSRNGVCGGAPSRTLHYGRRCRPAEREKRQSRGAVRPRRKGGRGRVHPAGWRRDVCCVRAGGRPPPRRERPFFLPQERGGNKARLIRGVITRRFRHTISLTSA